MNKSKIKALVATAYSDGFFDSRELFIINSRAKDLGLSGEEIIDIIRNPENEVLILPVTDTEKLEFMYDLMRVICADENIDTSERSIFFRYLGELGFNQDMHQTLFNSMSKAAMDRLDFGSFVEFYVQDND